MSLNPVDGAAWPPGRDRAGRKAAPVGRNAARDLGFPLRARFGLGLRLIGGLS